MNSVEVSEETAMSLAEIGQVARMSRLSNWIALALAAAVTAAGCAQNANAVKPSGTDSPETVLATFRVKAERMPEFLTMMPDYWKALREQNLVNAAPYVLMVGEEEGKPVVYEVFSWKDHEVADHVPATIQAYWKRINEMVESRGGRPGIDFPEVKLVSPAP